MKCLTLYTISYCMYELSWFTYDFIKTCEMNKEINQIKEDQMLFKKRGGGADYPDRSLTKKIINNL